MRAEPIQIVKVAHALGVHTAVVLTGWSEWQNWCEREGVDPEVMTFDDWLDDMQAMADALGDRDD